MVIQRWQSLLLLVASVMMAVFTFCSLGQISTPEYVFDFTSLGFFQEGIPTGGAVNHDYHTWYLFTVSLTSVVLLLLDIFLFRNLQLQKKVCLISVLFVVASAATAGCLGYTAIENGEIMWSSVVCAPFLALIATVMAYGRMVSDQNKLRAADRIR